MLSKITLKATKLTPPKRSGALIIRNHLLQKLYLARQKHLILLDAPAGYGKTNLLAQFYNQLLSHNLKASWINCEVGDDDKVIFLAYLIEAIRKVFPNFGQETLAIISHGISLPGDTFETIFLNELAEIEADTYIFIDDFHLLLRGEVKELLETLMTENLPNIHFCISTRDKGNLQLHKLRVNAELEHLTIEDLQFDSKETLDFLNADINMNVSSDLAQELCLKTEGWVAALQLAAITLEGKKDKVLEWVGSFSGKDKTLGEFLVKEVFNTQPKEVQNFLLKTSILKKFNAELCDFVVGDNNSQDLIKIVDKKNLFLFSLDTDGEWYRYHHLFSDFLYKLLKNDRVISYQALHKKAGLWLSENNMENDAIYHAFESGDFVQAAKILNSVSPQLFARGRTSQLERYAEKLPRDLIKKLPHLQLSRAWNYDLVLSFDKARKALDEVHHYLHEADEQSDEYQIIRSTLAHREMFLNFRQDDVVRTLEQAEKWLKEYSTEDPFKCASTSTIIILCKKELYNTDDVLLSLPTLYSLCLQSAALYGTVFLDSLCGAVLLMRGELKEALKILKRGRERAIELHGELSSLASMPSVIMAEVLYERNQLENANSLLSGLDYNYTTIGYIENFSAGFLTKIKILIRRGEFDKAQEEMELANLFAKKYGFVRLELNILQLKVQLLCEHGESKQALQFCNEQKWAEYKEQLKPFHNVTTKHEMYCLAYFRAMSANQRGGEIIAALKAWVKFISPRHCHQAYVRLSILLVKVLLQHNEPIVAQRYLIEVIQIAAREGYFGTLIDEGSLIAKQVVFIREQTDPSDQAMMIFLNTLINSYEELGILEEVCPEVYADPTEIVFEEFNTREREILGLSKDSVPNKDIAAQLGLSESTIKWYWQRIYTKLDVKKRSDAIRKARFIGILH